MEDQVPQEGNYYQTPEVPPSAPPMPQAPQMNLEEMRARALQEAISQVRSTGATVPPPLPQPLPVPQPQETERVVYVRRNLTIAEVILVFAISTLGVLSLQAGIGFVSDILPRIEIRDK